ncbi:UNKNOWN [Stylonychia lemnae]|uniref:Peptidase S1 domain-containing protein n=1 Tax=Stylonychia lemnae TaxID=5949 RepID=A0A078AZ37_STYLE|nr:UNKNOWN [Stylonychia lemnae]|eukprot:CDW87371.1 UNKNOWN [Stylonychia lemnae]
MEKRQHHKDKKLISNVQKVDFTTDIDDEIMDNIFFFEPGEKLIQGREAILSNKNNIEKREKVNPQACLTSYPAIQGQIIAQYGRAASLGSGALCKDANNHVFLLTAAHNFVQIHEALDYKVNYSEKIMFDLCKSEARNYLKRFRVMTYIVHPLYINNHHFSQGYDIAVARLCMTDQEQAEIPVSEDSFWTNIEEIELKINDDLCVIGYPGEYNGLIYQMKGTVANIIEKEGLNKVLIYEDIDTTKGQSGGSVYTIKDGFYFRVGVHAGCDKTLNANVATAITPEIHKWIQSAVGLMYNQ